MSIFERRKTVNVTVGGIGIGSEHPITVQSMTNTDTHNVDATYDQIMRLHSAGCEIVRLAVPDIEAASTFVALKKRNVPLPLVADIHFDYKIALAAIEAGADKIRINPGNIGSREKVIAVVKACKERSLPIRIGVNSGSLDVRRAAVADVKVAIVHCGAVRHAAGGDVKVATIVHRGAVRRSAGEDVH